MTKCGWSAHPPALVSSLVLHAWPSLDSLGEGLYLQPKEAAVYSPIRLTLLPSQVWSALASPCPIIARLHIISPCGTGCSTQFLMPLQTPGYGWRACTHSNHWLRHSLLICAKGWWRMPQPGDIPSIETSILCVALLLASNRNPLRIAQEMGIFITHHSDESQLHSETSLPWPLQYCLFSLLHSSCSRAWLLLFFSPNTWQRMVTPPLGSPQF